MALVALLRGVNVGGHRTFKPAQVAKNLGAFDVVNIGAAGTYVVRKPGSEAKFRAALNKQLPFETTTMICDGREILRIIDENPFGRNPPGADTVRFVTVLAKAAKPPAIPIAFPEEGEWLVRVTRCDRQFVFGEYRRHMKTIGYLRKLDQVFKDTGTTRNWNTIMAIGKALTAS